MRFSKRHLAGLCVLVVCVLLAGLLILRTGLSALDTARYPRQYSEYVEYYAGKYNLDPLLLYSLIRTESGFDPEATSSVEARGLMQITEVTFDWIKSRIAPGEDLTFDDLYDPETNIRFGSYYLAQCLNRYGNDVDTAAAAYHSGWGTVDDLLEDSAYSSDGVTLHTFPFEQMNLYVRKINRSYEAYQRIYSEEYSI